MAEASALISVIQSVKATQDIVSSLIGLRVSAEVSGKIAEANKHLVEMTERLVAAQRENAALIRRIGELEEEAMRSKRQHGELEDYQLSEVSPGVTVYTMKPGAKISEPAHWLCPNCFANAHKSILQHDALFSVAHEEFVCPKCKSFVDAPKGVFPR